MDKSIPKVTVVRKSRREAELEAENESLRQKLKDAELELKRVNRVCEYMSRELDQLRDD